MFYGSALKPNYDGCAHLPLQAALAFFHPWCCCCGPWLVHEEEYIDNLLGIFLAAPSAAPGNQVTYGISPCVAYLAELVRSLLKLEVILIN